MECVHLQQKPYIVLTTSGCAINNQLEAKLRSWRKAVASDQERLQLSWHHRRCLLFDALGNPERTSYTVEPPGPSPFECCNAWESLT